MTLSIVTFSLMHSMHCLLLGLVSFMQSVTDNPFTLSVVMLSVTMLSVTMQNSRINLNITGLGAPVNPQTLRQGSLAEGEGSARLTSFY